MCSSAADKKVRETKTAQTPEASKYVPELGRSVAIDPAVAEAQYHAGNVHVAGGRFAEAKKCLMEALTIFMWSDDQESFAKSPLVMTDLGQLYLLTGKHDECMAILGKAREMFRMGYGPRSPWEAMTLQTMARSVCVSIICFIIHPPDISAWILFIYTHPRLHACRSIGRSNRPDSSEGNQQEAITKLDEAYSIFKENFGAEHITIAACLADKALLLRLLRRYDEALKLNEEALKMFIKEAPGGVSPQVATTTQCIGTILADTGRLEEAKEKYEESLSLLRRVHGGRDHPDVATALNNVSDILQKQGRWDES